MGAAAVAAARRSATSAPARSSSSPNADGFYFLEMNTRLQVEHPVTEMITGFDLVEWQLRVAAGEPLPVAQDHDRHQRPRDRGADLRRGPGARLRPLDRAARAVPHCPRQRSTCAIDTGFATGDTVSVHYDAMLAKLICHGPTRDEALRTAAPRAGATPTSPASPATSICSARIVAHPDFAAGGVDTGFIARDAAALLAPQREPPADVLAAAALGVLTRKRSGARPRRQAPIPTRPGTRAITGG